MKLNEPMNFIIGSEMNGMKRETIFLSGIFINMKQKEVFICLINMQKEPANSHPNKDFAAKVSPLFCKFIVDVMNGVIE